ncbi:MAG: valine--tRNA ligase [Deltaproteobacteria bacterium]|nr:valine--tRNA ligase [Deltaproteobacteria bacterium]
MPEVDQTTLPKVYEPHEVEKKWYAFWQKKGYFHADASSKSPPFCMVIPPPNVTGSLHMGHALNSTLQDIVCRYKRMKGFNVLWLPGTDHAGIATQNVVERELAKEGKRRQDLGREKFIERVWLWKQKYGREILTQLKRLGTSCDWERERFTMDLGLSKAVREAFVTLYEEKLIYRDKYLINWCPRCRTALSDLEVEHQEMEGQLWYIRYSSEIVVATTRPETMLGDTAVAVNTSDERYQKLIGQKILLPIVNREIPIIGDHRVDREFGTGAVKVTPAHDFNDFALGNDHKLPRINIFTEDGHMNEGALHFKGLDRFECRKKIVQELEEKGFLEKIEKHRHNVGHCYRCRTVVEPYLSLQWFVKAKPLAAPAMEAVKKGKTRFIPENWQNTYFVWMENIKDWCISRQIWWGHQIPAWYCENEKCPVIVSREDPKQCPHCGNTKLEQDPDVLDTWFSSALWPFSTLGWPEKSVELKKFYPTALLVTGFDIIFFWVARMMMMGLKFMGEVPFKEVNIHALVRDIQGQKMSKSKGNVIDPLTVMDQFGTDAFRFTLASLAAQGRDIKLSEKTIEGYRNFANKIWNASRFALMNLGEKVGPVDESPLGEPPLGLYDRWILHTLDYLTVQVDRAYQEYRFDEAAHLLYDFFWHDFCDWYLEFSKTESHQPVLRFVLEEVLKLLHPIMPFITEELWQRLKTEGESLMTASFPKAGHYRFEKESAEVEHLKEVVTAIRTIRSENRINPGAAIPVVLSASGKGLSAILQNHSKVIERLARVSTLKVTTEKVSSKGMAHESGAGFDVFIPLEGLIDFENERKRLAKEIGKLKQEVNAIQNRLAQSNFVNNAPPEIVAQEREKESLVRVKLAKFEETLKNLA